MLIFEIIVDFILYFSPIVSTKKDRNYYVYKIIEIAFVSILIFGLSLNEKDIILSLILSSLLFLYISIPNLINLLIKKDKEYSKVVLYTFFSVLFILSFFVFLSWILMKHIDLKNSFDLQNFYNILDRFLILLIIIILVICIFTLTLGYIFYTIKLKIKLTKLFKLNSFNKYQHLRLKLQGKINILFDRNRNMIFYSSYLFTNHILEYINFPDVIRIRLMLDGLEIYILNSLEELRIIKRINRTSTIDLKIKTKAKDINITLYKRIDLDINMAMKFDKRIVKTINELSQICMLYNREKD